MNDKYISKEWGINPRRTFPYSTSPSVSDLSDWEFKVKVGEVHRITYVGPHQGCPCNGDIATVALNVPAPSGYRLVGLVVKAFASRVEGS